MNVTVGKPAPDLEVEVEAYMRGDYEPRRLSLSQYRGKWVVLFFYPRDFTFVCPTEIAGFEALRHEFESEGAAIIGASTDSYWSHKAWFESEPRLLDVSYPIAADTAHRLSDAYGVLLPDGAAQRGTFVVDPEGIVRYASVTDLNVGRSVEETLRVVRALQTGELCPAGWRPGEATLLAA
jgi:alkyl hydroperoxide reductase subunit AhpC